MNNSGTRTEASGEGTEDNRQSSLFEEVQSDGGGSGGRNERNREHREKFELPHFELVPIERLGDHPQVGQAFANLRLALMLRAPADLLRPAGIRRLGLWLPIPAIKTKKGGYLCFGNLRLLRLAQASLTWGTTMPVLIYEGTDIELSRIEEATFLEFVVLTILFQLSYDDKRSLYANVLSRLQEIPSALTLLCRLKMLKWADYLHASFNSIRKPKPASDRPDLLRQDSTGTEPTI